MRRPAPEDHRRRCAAELAERVVAELRELGDALAREELWGCATRRRLPRRRLRAVLAKLGDVPLTIRIGPGAGLAVVTVLLVEGRERSERPANAHLRVRVPEARDDTSKPRGRSRRLGDLDLREIFLGRKWVNCHPERSEGSGRAAPRSRVLFGVARAARARSCSLPRSADPSSLRSTG